MAVVWKEPKAECMQSVMDPAKWRVLIGDSVVATCDSETEAKALTKSLTSLMSASAFATRAGQ